MSAIDSKPNLPVAATAVQFLKGVGPKLAQLLGEKLQIHTIGDLWFHLPRNYEDRTQIVRAASASIGASCQLEGGIEHAEIVFRGRRSLVATLFDGTARVRLRFFHFRQAQLEQLQSRPRVRVFGELRMHGLGLEITHPQIMLLDADAPALASTLTPIYPKSEGLSDERLRKIIDSALAELPPSAEFELLPRALLQTLKWSDLAAALRYVHAPPAKADLNKLLARAHPAQRRLAGEELLAHQLSMRLIRQQTRQLRAPVLRSKGLLRQRLLQQLGFSLTAAQTRVCAEIAADLAHAQPMLRLVQGDVGSGKTVVAALAACAAMECGLQVALIAPTELLAEQHFRNFSRWFEPLGIELVWLAGKVKGKARKAALDRIDQGAALVIGTHALMSDSVRFAQLGLCIIDEQHRFGVQQRLALRNKGMRTEARGTHIVPHQLVMTATPIPRTLAMVSYADLDVSIIDELPPGRTPVQTVVVSNQRREELITRIREALAAGRQAYWVCTLIVENELLEAKAAEQSWQELCAALPEWPIGLVHGKLKPKEKDAVMQAFARGELRLLVATTVIEVGVDVPQASLMLIDNAERLGLSQLHQLRGRVGRGSAQSSCVLIYQAPLSQTAESRLNILRESNDGFVIAEQDQLLRGPGEFLGTKQTGEQEFRIADVQRDADLLEQVRIIADQLLADKTPDGQARVQALIRRWIGQAMGFSAV